MRKAAALMAIVAGLVLVAVPLAYSMFDRTDKAERILDRFEFLTLDDNPERYLAEAEVTRDGSTELVEEAIPGLAAEAGIPEDQLDERYPALAEAQETVPAAHDFSVRYSEQLDAVDEKFQSVYDIPVSWLPLTATAWMFVAGGFACLLAGAVALRGTGRGPLAAILVIGSAMALGPVLLGGVGKATDGEDVKDFAENGLTDRAATAAQEASADLDGLVIETEQQTLPDIAEARGVAPQTVEQELEEDYPVAAEFLAEWDVIGPRLATLADAVSASVGEFDSARKLPIAFPVWLLIGLGVAMAVAAGVALRGAQDSRV
jgi:hypothetical protein